MGGAQPGHGGQTAAAARRGEQRWIDRQLGTTRHATRLPHDSHATRFRDARPLTTQTHLNVNANVSANVSANEWCTEMIHPSIYRPIDLSTYRPIHLSTYPPIHLSTYPPIHRGERLDGVRQRLPASLRVGCPLQRAGHPHHHGSGSGSGSG